MFTGIVEETGRFAGFEGDVITIEASMVMDDISLGDSISVNGCCLTVTEKDDSSWKADISEETRKRTTMEFLTVGDRVNLERAAKVSDRIGGHIVQGHVDAVGEVLNSAPELRVRIPENILRYVVEKGSVTIDGVSLTIVHVFDDGFDVALIPHTLEVTNLGSKKPGDKVNIEVDIMAKYAERFIVYRPTFEEE